MELQLASAMASETERERKRMGERQRGERSGWVFPNRRSDVASMRLTWPATRRAASEAGRHDTVS